MTEPVVLPAVLDLRAAGALTSEFLARRGQPLTVDASGVERLGGLSLQVLLSAAKTWAADGMDLTVAPVSEAFVEQCRAFGAAALAPDFAGDPA
ncbi:STAS domain-containing protein [Brevundimonas viscosa]|uniref:Chemotaxis protein CheX n=1 Tax=Brevundimonas viscosa TaxID=871741 RepID=A0A1I6TB71_9CAUL|nr:STAS domain-containing protein [Brevundimonas viscosa]SFS86459.1 chemotaxis protein CheX [Brevundimonas viscosa]